MDNAVALAALGLTGSTIAALVWVVKYLANTLSKDLQEHTKAALKQQLASKEQATAARKSTAASNEMLIFMKALNGKLRKATIQTIQEQKVERQTIEKRD